MVKRQVFVIGGGVGGLSVAADLLSQDLAVTILEKNERVGGRLGGWREGGYRWPLGATTVFNPKQYEQPFGQAGKEAAKYFTMRRLEKPYYWQQNKLRHIYEDDLDGMLKRLGQYGDEQRIAYLDYLADGAGRYALRKQYDRYKIGEQTESRSLRDYELAQPLEDWLSFLAAYPGGNPRTKKTASLWQPAVVQLEGVWHIEGGMAAYGQALAHLVEELGGEIHTGEAAEEIVLAGGRAVGVRSEQGLYLADAVVCAVDKPMGLQKLLPQVIWDEEEWEASCGIFALHLLAEGPFDQLAVHNIISGKKLSDTLAAAYRGVFSRHPSLYLYRSPEASAWEQLTVYCRVPNQLLRAKRWRAREKSRLVRRILAVLAEVPALEGLPKKLRAMACVTPLDLAKYFQTAGGAAFGPASGSESAPEVEGLYWAGDWASGRAGVHQVLAYSQQVAEIIVRDLNQMGLDAMIALGEKQSDQG